MTEKLCVFCKHFEWERVSQWESDYSGGENGGMTCRAGQYSEFHPHDEDDFRTQILKANECAFYDVSWPAKPDSLVKGSE